MLLAGKLMGIMASYRLIITTLINYMIFFFLGKPISKTPLGKRQQKEKKKKNHRNILKLT